MPQDLMESAAKAVDDGASIRQAAKQYGINRNTLKRFIDRKATGSKHLFGYGAVKEKQQIFSDVMEEDLAHHVKELSRRFYGLTSVKCEAVK